MPAKTESEPLSKAQFYETVVVFLCLLLGLCIGNMFDKEWFQGLLTIFVSGMMVLYGLRWYKARFTDSHKGREDT